jgi:hypothetical protein
MSFAAPRAQAEPAACLSADPAQWPSPAKPYFMIAFDTSGSMTIDVTVGGAPQANSCGYGTNRIGHGKCALKNMFQAFGGQVNFGLAAFARGTASGCTASCGTTGNGSCVWQSYPGGGIPSGGCGPEPTSQPNSEDRRGGEILVPMQRDNFYAPPLDPTNVPELLKWVDNDCSPIGTLSHELWAAGETPLNGILRDMYRYMSNEWTRPTGSPTYASPIADVGERPCRTINTILITDGDESCDADPADPIDAAADLFAGFTKGGITWKVKTYVITFGGGTPTKANQIAAAGGTGLAVNATNEATLSAALANIVSQAIKPETCDNADNNCNGCTDEGFKRYCNIQQTCCNWSTPAQRATCMSNYQATITAQNPSGNLALLPCTTAIQQQDPATWLCYNPSESCDNIDNNCQDGVDEGVLKCGSPAHCPKAETCNSEDDDCDGQVDEGDVCKQPCKPSPEVCDGCDNDCDGVIDDEAPPAPCGLTSPANCAGQLTCKPSQAAQFPGQCVSGGGFNACNNSPIPETCDGLDNDCDGIADDGLPPTACTPPGTPAGLNYGPNSQCKLGSRPCNGTCQGFVGPSLEICDGIDNDCDGQVDEQAFNVGTSCGFNQAPCTLGTTACVNGALVCQGGVQPSPEVCDGIDNNCNGSVDETPLADATASGQTGCWTTPGNCCKHGNLTWCPPQGGTCAGNGILKPPCNKGTLTCQGTQKWVCTNVQAPAAEACDGVDNDCDGTIDESPIPQVGQPCGSDTGECVAGALVCTAGVLDCQNDVGPKAELCDGKDNDCDGNIDNGIASGGPCVVPYDVLLYPGDRTKGACEPGEFLCDSAGMISCLQGQGPQPEVCDGIDNDCDGTIDESGPAPDGVDGSQNPQPEPKAKIGDACGSDTGECNPGKYTCQNGQFVCTGATTPTLETCDCNDNDCDGTSDNKNGGIAICSTGKECVKSSSGACQCAGQCNPGKEYPCPPGQQCQQVTESQTGQMLGFYCVAQPCSDCETKTVKDANGKVLCAPADTTPDANCYQPPVCVCKGQAGCRNPCDGVTCSAGQVCSDFGPLAGKCVVNNCYNVPCPGCNKACNLGSCLDNPCKPDSCAAGEVCKPSGDFTTFTCVPTCAGVMCPQNQVCQDGACVPGCSPACGADQFCDLSQSPPTCVDDKCGGAACPGGGCCNPVTGACGNCPCEGVICPEGQACKDGQCDVPSMGSGGASSSTGVGGAGGAGGGGGSNTGGAGGTGNDDRGVFGLPTGGGGCSCEVAGDAKSSSGWLVLFGIPVVFLRRRVRAARIQKEVA